MVKRGGSGRTVQRLVRGCWLHCSERGRLLRCPGRGGGHREEVWRRRSAVLVRPAARQCDRRGKRRCCKRSRLQRLDAAAQGRGRKGESPHGGGKKSDLKTTLGS